MDFTNKCDPFEILGLETSCDKRAVKKAYAKMIKQYKPHSHKNEFQKIRQAYEQLMDKLCEEQEDQWPTASLEGFDQDDAEEGILLSKEDATSRNFASYFPNLIRVREGKEIEETRPQTKEEVLDKFLSLDSIGAPKPWLPILQALVDGIQLDDDLFRFLSDKELRDLVKDPSLTLTHLLRQENDAPLSRLLNCRWFELLKVKKLDLLAQEALSQEIAIRWIDSSPLNECYQDLASLLLCEDPVLAARLLKVAPFEDDFMSLFRSEYYDIRLQITKDLPKLTKADRLPQSLLTYLAQKKWDNKDEMQPLVDDIVRSLVYHPKRYPSPGRFLAKFDSAVTMIKKPSFAHEVSQPEKKLDHDDQRCQAFLSYLDGQMFFARLPMHVYDLCGHLLGGIFLVWLIMMAMALYQGSFFSILWQLPIIMIGLAVIQWFLTTRIKRNHLVPKLMLGIYWYGITPHRMKELVMESPKGILKNFKELGLEVFEDPDLLLLSSLHFSD